MRSSEREAEQKTSAQPEIRCAIYTRKSTDDGLDQDFNSLDAQRESAEAYITSQRHEGWVCLPTRYDDGGFTGGNTDRPALQRLLSDVKAGEIDCIICYKIDRISRSLLDFARLMETFEDHNVSLVAVTQQLNTKNSMGRLTLNILLSFAQFEREIIAERTRDKMSAARKKGKWIGGYPIFGYDVDRTSKRLVINEEEALQVRAIFQIYLEHKSLLQVVRLLNQRNWCTKQWTTKKGVVRGGRQFSKNNLHRLLTNILYTGNLRYQNEIYEGEHEQIVDEKIWQQVQQLLRQNGRNGGELVRNKHGGILKGIIRCEPCDCGMIHTISKKKDKRYRYYVCNKAQQQGWGVCPTKSLNAQEIESAVVERIRGIGTDKEILKRTIESVREKSEKELSELDAERKKIRRRLNELHASIRKLIGRLDETCENESPATDRLADLQDQVLALEKRSKEIRSETTAIRKRMVDEKELKQALSSFEPVWESLSIAEQSRLMRLLVKSVDIDGAAGTVTVNFNNIGIKLVSAESRMGKKP